MGTKMRPLSLRWICREQNVPGLPITMCDIGATSGSRQDREKFINFCLMYHPVLRSHFFRISETLIPSLDLRLPVTENRTTTFILIPPEAVQILLEHFLASDRKILNMCVYRKDGQREQERSSAL